MEIEVRFLTSVREIAGREEDEIQSLKAITVEKLLVLLSEKYGRKFAEYVYDKGKGIRKYIQILVNGKDIRVLQGLETKLEDGDIVSVSAAVGGGIHL